MDPMGWDCHPTYARYLHAFITEISAARLNNTGRADAATVKTTSCIRWSRLPGERRQPRLPITTSSTMSSSATPSVTHDLLSRAHSPDSVSRIFTEKIQYRSLLLRPSSPPPAANAREARRKAREDKKRRRKALKPKPLTSIQRRRLGLYDVPKEGRRYETFAPLNQLWIGYMRELLGNELYTGGQSAAAKLSAADYHGAEIVVVRSACPSRVGIRGIVVKDSKFAFEIITKKNNIKLVPKEKTMFRFEVPAEDNSRAAPVDQKDAPSCFAFEVHGDQFQYRSGDRANKKFKAHYLKDI